ncbi:hypothetical protein BDZ89DRAFT_1130746 [Hymenopellis radicata]|nr:hypothetical protein BDZ89DRAFT_1130746 [Hymenopellis radicata]
MTTINDQHPSPLAEYHQAMYSRHSREQDSVGHSARFSQPTFQIPPFMNMGPPTLAPGGGAEVLPLGGSMWMENSGFNFNAFDRQYDLPQSSKTTTSNYSSLKKVFDYDESSSDTSQSYQSSAPFDYDDTIPTSTVTHTQPPQPSVLNSFIAPSSLGLPVYSTSGFDILSVFGRVANRPNPQIQLGPVDLTSSFVVVDVRRFDQPIVYCSPTFCRLTGYEEREILAKNCRFLQAPPSVTVHKGDERKWTSNEAVKHIKKCLVAGKECQASIVNYRRDGSAFINLVTVIPVPEDNGDPIYMLGFQVDLTEQPTAILDRLKDGSYIAPNVGSDLHSVSKKPLLIPPIVTSDALVLPPGHFDDCHPLSMALLSGSPDFVLVVSLKGVFLYVAPAVKHVLGYTPADLLDKSLGDIAHAADVVPLMRELKESSAPGEKPRPVDLLFRARTNAGRWVWVECRGRLHVEPGKGRKAIVLCARVKDMGGLEAPLTSGVCGHVTKDGTILVVTRAVSGWNPEDLVGRSWYSLFEDLRSLPEGPVRTLMIRKDGGKAEVHVTVWRQDGGDDVPRVYQITDTPSISSASFNVFEELQTERGSSWQYELQQLRFRNQRLEEQIRGLEEQTTTTVTSTPFTPATAAPSTATYVSSSGPFSFGEAERPSYPVSLPIWYGPTSSLKRSWDGGT